MKPFGNRDRGVQQQQPGVYRQVSICTGTHLLAASMRQHTPMLEDEKGLCDPGLLLGALLWLAPLQGLDLHLPVDASKAASLLQHCLQAGLTVRKEKTTTFGVNVTRSQVLYRAAQRPDCQCLWDKCGLCHKHTWCR